MANGKPIKYSNGNREIRKTFENNYYEYVGTLYKKSTLARRLYILYILPTYALYTNIIPNFSRWFLRIFVFTLLIIK